MVQLFFRRLLIRPSLPGCYKVTARSFSSTYGSGQEYAFTPFHASKVNTDPVLARMNKSTRPRNANQNRPSKRRKVEKTRLEGTNDDILAIEARELLERHQEITERSDAETTKGEYYLSTEASPEYPLMLQLEVKELSSTGEGLALSEDGDHVYTVPFTVPGDVVRAKVFHQQKKGQQYSPTDFVEIVTPSPDRDDSQIKCQYFQTCSGCQLQMMPYEKQLAYKRTIVQKAYRFFSDLPLGLIPAIGDTIGSPLKYSYRTKLTPHFDGPPSKDGRRVLGFTEVPPFGFTIKGRKKVMDIENCPIGTDVVQEGFKRERERLGEKISSYKRGATILLRESTKRIPTTLFNGKELTNGSTIASNDPISTELSKTPSGDPLLRLTYRSHTDEKTYTNDMNGTSTEYIDDWTFKSRAGSFFQNNNSILSTFTAYVRDHARSPPGSPTTSSEKPIKYLLDAYCGSGLFTVTLSTLFRSALGVDVDPQGIAAARNNAAANNLPNAGFIEGDASDIFADVPFPPDQTLVVIDPPRKGASEDFLEQLMRYGPKRVVYVSCNVHTQARDVGFLVRGVGKWRYDIESLRGFDFFPQTGHVEGVAVLNRVELKKERLEVKEEGVENKATGDEPAEV